MLSRRGLMGLLPAMLAMPLLGKSAPAPKLARVILHKGGRLENVTVDGGIQIAGPNVTVRNCFILPEGCKYER